VHAFGISNSIGLLFGLDVFQIPAQQQALFVAVLKRHIMSETYEEGRPVAVWEAKRTGNYFELPAGRHRIIYPLKSLCKDNPGFKKAFCRATK